MNTTYEAHYEIQVIACLLPSKNWKKVNKAELILENYSEVN